MRGKQPCLIQPEERLAIEGGDADAKLRVTERRIGQDGLDAVCQRTRNGRRCAAARA